MFRYLRFSYGASHAFDEPLTQFTKALALAHLNGVLPFILSPPALSLRQGKTGVRHPRKTSEKVMSETRQRTARILIRALPEEEAAIRERARAAGVSVPEYLRRAALSRRIDHSASVTAEALHKLGRIGNNLNQLTHLAHVNEHNQEALSRILADVSAATSFLLEKGGGK